MILSARNQLGGTIVELEHGVVTTTVKVRFDGATVITSSITREAAEDLDLAVGQEVVAVIKSSDVIIGKD